jgi:hypothetical protein
MERPEQEALLEERQERHQQYEAGGFFHGRREIMQAPRVFVSCSSRFGSCSRQAEGGKSALLCRV